MSTVDIKAIEQALSIQLPSHYINFMAGYQPESAHMGSVIYTDAGQLIAFNKKLGFYGTEKSIKHRYVIGGEGGDWYLISLDNPDDTRVFYFDHEASVEECYDEATGSWDWDAFESNENLPAVLEELMPLFDEYLENDETDEDDDKNNPFYPATTD